MRLQLTGAALLVLVARPGTAQQTSTGPDEPVTEVPPAARRVTGHFKSELSLYSDSDHVDVLTPSIAGDAEDETAGWSARGQYLVDAVSAASVDIVSTASPHWTEVRQAGSAEGALKRRDLGVSGSGSVSSEPDYLGWATGGSVSLDLDQKNFVLAAGYNYGHDTIGRSGTPFSVFSRSLTRNALNAGLTIVMNPSTLVVLGGDLIFERGDQSKPYRYIPLFASDVAPVVPQAAPVSLVNMLRLPDRPLEQLPLARDRYALWGRFLHRFSASTLRLEERLYTDSWNLHASTTDVRFLKERGEHWQWRSHARFHAQSPVSFWSRAYTLTEAGVPALRTGDRELGPLWNATGGGGLRWRGGRDRPAAWTIGGDIDVTWTSFLDDLYIGNRLAGILTLSWETEL
jgi:hypothetical protein